MNDQVCPFCQEKLTNLDSGSFSSPQLWIGCPKSDMSKGHFYLIEYQKDETIVSYYYVIEQYTIYFYPQTKRLLLDTILFSTKPIYGGLIDFDFSDFSDLNKILAKVKLLATFS